jgi:hypothetical protein
VGLIVAPVVVHRWQKRQKPKTASRQLSEQELSHYRARIEKDLAEME